MPTISASMSVGETPFAHPSRARSSEVTTLALKVAAVAAFALAATALAVGAPEIAFACVLLTAGLMLPPMIMYRVRTGTFPELLSPSRYHFYHNRASWLPCPPHHGVPVSRDPLGNPVVHLTTNPYHPPRAPLGNRNRPPVGRPPVVSPSSAHPHTDPMGRPVVPFMHHAPSPMVRPGGTGLGEELPPPNRPVGQPERAPLRKK